MGPFSADRSRFERLTRTRTGAVRRFALTCGVAFGIAVTTATAAPPAASLDAFRSQASLSSSEMDQIRAFASEHYTQLCGDDLDRAEESRSALLHALRGAPVGTFRSAFMSELRARMVQQLRGDNLFAKVNTVLVLSEIGNSSALDVLDDNVKLSDQPSWQVRLATAKAIVAVINGPDASTFDAQTLGGTARLVAGAAQSETNPNALRAQLVAIVACDQGGLSAATRIQIFRLFENATARLASTSVSFDDRAEMASAVDAAANAIFPTTLHPMGSPQALPPTAAKEIAKGYVNVLKAYARSESITPAQRRVAAAVVRRLQTQIVRLAKSVEASVALPSLDTKEPWDGIDTVEFEQYVNGLDAALKQLP